MKLSDYVAERISSLTSTVFGYQGSSVSHLIDSLYKYNINYVQSNHEQASAFNGCGYAEMYGRLSVVIACSGPGSTNLITGIANAYYDSLPVLFIVGQVSTKEFKCNNSRQNGFQQTNIVEIVKSITKYSVEIQNPIAIFNELEKCIEIAQKDRKGPTLISLPHNIQSCEIVPDIYNKNTSLFIYNEDSTIKRSKISYNFINKTICDSHRPLLLIGGGCKNYGKRDFLSRFLNLYRIPVVSSLRGLNNLPDCNYIGMVGIYGNREANLCVYKCDLLIVLGSRLDARQTGGNPDSFAPNAKIIHVDCDENEINREICVDYPIITTCENFLYNLISINNDIQHDFREWDNLLSQIKELSIASIGNLPLQYRFLQSLMDKLKAVPLVVSADVGQNQMWVAQTFLPGNNKFFLTSGGHGSMGYSLPAMIGANFESSENTLKIAFMGDGGFQMNIQELETMHKEKINACIVIFNNQGLGLIKDYQDKALSGRNYGSSLGYANPSFQYIAKAYGMGYLKITEDNYEIIGIDTFINKQIILEVILPQKTTIIPEIAYQHSIFDQYPFINLDMLSHD